MTTKHTYIERHIEDRGDRVNCDFCNEEFLKGDPREGGFLFGRDAICPKCATLTLRSIAKHKEERFIKAYCPPKTTFHNWVMALRNGDNRIVTTTMNRRKE